MVKSSHQPEATPPRWVKALGIVTAVLALMGVGHFLTGGGPGLHTPSSAQEHGAQP
jgi:hypothetical protein